MFSGLWKGIVGSFALLYPYLVYRGLQAGVVWYAPTVVVAILTMQALRADSLTRRWRNLGLALLLIMGMLFWENFTAKSIPTLIQLLLMHFFGKTLINGPPLIERFVRFEFPEIPPELLTYCQQLTYLWTGFFGFNALMCSVLAIWGKPEWWAFYTGVLIFVLTGLLMVGEYIYRHFRFPGLSIPDLKTSARNMLLNSRQLWKDVQAS